MHVPIRLLAILCSASMSAKAADNAFIPPETRTGGRPVVGFQVEFQGWVGKFDHTRHRAHRTKICAMLGKPYINDTSVDEAAKSRMIVVQTQAASYTWTETNFLEMAERGDLCRWKLVTRSVLVVARFDGRRTVVSTYKYDRRRKSQFVRQGDFTYFGSHTIDVQKDKVTGKRRLGGIDCSDMRFLELGGKEDAYESVCLTGSDPFPGRHQPLILAWHSGTDKEPRYHMNATMVRPGIIVDSAVLDGPEGFEDRPRPSRSGGQGEEDHEDGGHGKPPVNPGRRH